MLAVLILSGACATADESYEYDPELGGEINEVCAGCHGEYGQGGKKGVYPRLAGLPSAFIATQLHLFRDRKRPNMAMVEYVDERQMPDGDIAAVSRYLSEIKLKTKLPPADETDPNFDAYARLLESKRLMQIPLAEGDVRAGERLYQRECASCHGKQGEGDRKKAVPLLAGQYTSYLWRQVKKYREKIRLHDPEDPEEEELLSDFSDGQLGDMFAYLSALDD